jgi:hypothetical protein
MRAMLPAKGWPPNMPVTTTGSTTARITTAAMPIQIINFLKTSMTTSLTDLAGRVGAFPGRPRILAYRQRWAESVRSEPRRTVPGPPCSCPHAGIPSRVVAGFRSSMLQGHPEFFLESAAIQQNDRSILNRAIDHPTLTLPSLGLFIASVDALGQCAIGHGQVVPAFWAPR